MAIPSIDHPCWKKLAAGGLSRLRTKHLGTQLLAKRLERADIPEKAKIEEIHAFFVRWEPILANEIAQLNTI